MGIKKENMDELKLNDMNDTKYASLLLINVAILFIGMLVIDIHANIMNHNYEVIAQIMLFIILFIATMCRMKE